VRRQRSNGVICDSAPRAMSPPCTTDQLLRGKLAGRVNHGQDVPVEIDVASAQKEISLQHLRNLSSGVVDEIDVSLTWKRMTLLHLRNGS
jgi:hypothetical protein